MTTNAESTDAGIGLPLVFGALATLGAIGMLVTAGDQTSGYAFAAAVVFASLAVVSLHRYG